MPSKGEPDLSPLEIIELRYLRKAVRYSIVRRDTPPSGKNTDRIPLERRRELDEISAWFTQEQA